MKETNQQFISTLGAVLDESLDSIDQNVLQRLDLARGAALKQDAVARTEMEEREYATVSASLDIGSADLDSELTRKLDGMRQRAVERLAEKPSHSLSRRLPTMLRELFSFDARIAVPAAMFAVMVTSVSLFYTPTPVETFTEVEEISLLASADDLELYENLDFYLWLAENGLPEEEI